MRTYWRSLLLALLSCVISGLYGNQPPPDHFGHDHPPESGPLFVKNEGQWPDQVQYATEIRSGKLYLEPNTFTYDFYDGNDLHDRILHRDRSKTSKESVKAHSFRVHFEGANPNARIFGEEKQEEWRNYFLGDDPSKWAGGVPMFAKAYYEDLYQGIDLAIYPVEQNLKYDLLVEPGTTSPANIRLRYEGVSSLKLIEGKLRIQTSVNEIWEQAPFAYQLVGGEKVEVPCNFSLRGKEIGFEFPQGYDQSLPLVIDPTLIFSTYTGATSDNWGYSATYDDDEFLYAGGIVFGTGYPTTSGAYDISFNSGSYDVSITKFHPNGTSRIYSTFLGGSNSEQPHSLVVNGNNELYVLGTTNSSNFPATNAYDVSHNGGNDIFVARFNAAGNSLLNATYIGGSNEDGINIGPFFVANSLLQNYGDHNRGEIIIGNSGDVFVASCTQSSDFPATAGAFQGSRGGMQDGCVIKLPANLGTLTWSTFLGGLSDDACYGLKLDATENVYVTGGTSSQDFPVTAGSYQVNIGGGIDGYIAHLSSNGQVQLAGTFLGTTAYDQCYFIETDEDFDVYVVGQTLGNFPVTAGVYTNNGSRQFVTKLSGKLDTIIYSTRFGSTNGVLNISPTAFLVDNCEYVYVSGWGGTPNFQGNTQGMPLLQPLQSTTDGQDLYFIVFQKDLVALDFASYYGGNGTNEHVDGGTSRFDKRAVIYQAVCAGCGGSNAFPTTPGVVGPQNLSSNCNLGAMRIEFPIGWVDADFIINPSPTGCNPHAVTFTNTSLNASNYLWDFGDNTTSIQTNPSHTYTSPGTYTVQLIAFQPNSCNLADTATQTVTVLPQPVATIQADTTICINEFFTLSAGGGVNYQWLPDPSILSGLNSGTITINPQVQTTYTVIVAGAGGCLDTTDVTISVFPSFPSAMTLPPDTTICDGDSCQLFGTANGTGTISWSPANFITSTTSGNPIVFPPTSTQYIMTVTDANGCRAYDTSQVNVSTFAANAGPDEGICFGDSVTVTGAGGGSGQYQWYEPGGNNYSGTSFVANDTSSTTYYLQVTDPFGCVTLDSMELTVFPLPQVAAFPDTAICLRESVNLQGTGGINYTWSPGTGLNNPNAQNPVATPTTTTTYSLVATDVNNCRNTDSLTIVVLPLPPADAGPDTTVCQDSAAILSASGGVGYSWTPSATLTNPNAATSFATPQVTTDYIVTVTGANGCREVDTARVTVTPTPVVDVSGDIAICKGKEVRLLATGTNQLWWSTGDTTNFITVRPDSTTTYSVTGFGNGCLTRANTVTITVNDTFPTADFLADPDTGYLPLQVNFANLSLGHVSSQWIFGDGYYSNLENTSHIYGDSGRFTSQLIVTNEFGCTDTARKVIWVRGVFTIFVPNAFTPNQDGLNDFFQVSAIGIDQFEVLIFDRWGQLVYTSNDKNFQWDGRFKSRDVQEEVYTWVIKATSHLGHRVKEAGTVTLLR